MRHNGFESKAHLPIQQSLAKKVCHDRGEIGVDADGSIIDFRSFQLNFFRLNDEAFVFDEMMVGMKIEQLF
jgi:hypothetical protein